MLLQAPPVERRCPRPWSLAAAAAALALAVAAAGLGLDAAAAPLPDKKEPPKEGPKDEPKKDEPKKADKPAQEARDDFTRELRKASEDLHKAIRDAQAQFQLNMDTEALQKELRKAQEEFQKAQRLSQDHLQKALDQARFTLDGFGGKGLGRGASARLGARLETVGPALAEQLGLKPGEGLVVEDIAPDSAAAKAGLKAHDVLVEVGGKPVTGKPDDLAKLLDSLAPDAKVDLVILRKGKKETLKGVTLAEARAPARRFGIGGPLLPLGADGVSISSQRTGDRFTTSLQEGPSLGVVVRGKIEGDKARVEEVAVTEGRTTERYDSLDKVPEKARALARQAVEITEKGVARMAPRP